MIQGSIENAQKLHEIGIDLIETDGYGVDSIKPKCAELKKQTEDLTQLLENRRVTLERSRELHERIDKVSRITINKKMFSSLTLKRCKLPLCLIPF